MNTSLALTTTPNVLAITQVLALERVHVIPARNNAEIVERMREASASFEDVRRFLKFTNMKNASKAELEMVNYALARARYRENMDLSIYHVAVLAGLTVEKVRRYFKRLQIQVGDRVTNAQASALMSAVADYS